MKKCLLMIDGGTTNTNFTLLDGENIIARTKQKVGASDTLSANSNKLLEDTVRREIESLQSQYNCTIPDVYASGMVTSNAGILEIPHVEAPVTLAKLADSIQTHNLAAVSEHISFHFVPGIKFTRINETSPDIMRGEEVEIFGAIKEEDAQKSILFLHFGSHNKMIRYERGVITKAITTLSGELLWAVSNETILKSSVASLDDGFVMDRDFVKKGYLTAKKDGFSRALFLTRIGCVLEGYTDNQALSFIFGSLVYSDLQAFAAMMSEPTDRLVLYGRDSFSSAFMICLDEFYSAGLKMRVEVIPFDQSQALSVRGIRLIHQYRTKGVQV